MTDHRPTRDEDVRPLDHDLPPGPLADRKCECSVAEGYHVPVGDEVESAHLLANGSRDALHRVGLDDGEILRFADDFVAEDRGGELEEFEAWAVRMHRRLERVGP